MTYKRLATVAILSLALSGAALAQQAPAPVQGQAATPAPPPASPSHLAAARELIGITGALATVDEMLPTFGEQIKRQAVSRPDMTKDLTEVLARLQPELDLQRTQILNRAAQTYASFMTEAEIRETVAFFRTPTGAKYIKVQGDLVEDLVEKVQAWSQEVSEYVMIRTRAEMAKRGHAMQ